MADSVEDREGQQLGNYRLLRLLRREGTADVYLGEQIFLKTQAAIKVLPGQLSQQELETFLAQTRIIARLKHPNILRVLEFGVEGRTPFLVTDYTPNGSLRQLYPPGARVPSNKIASYVKQMAEALHYIHAQGLVHGGVRPENILLGSQDRILLGDFGATIDRLETAETLKSGEARARELNYMAPELFQGEASPASDQYALGVIAYEWLSGDLPFRGSESEIERHALTSILLQTKIPTASPELAQVIATALAKDPQQRFADVTAFASALVPLLQRAHLLGEALLDANSHSTSMQLQTRRVHTRSRITGAVGISLILIAILLIGGVFLFPRPNTVEISAQATQTAVARSAQRAAATFTAHPDQDIYTLATRGNPSMNDPLNTKSKSTWQTFQVSSGGCTFSDEAYILRVKQAKTYINCKSIGTTLHNFAFEVEMSIVKGSNGGITFRANGDDSKFYALRVTKTDSAFYYNFVAYNNEKQTDIQTTNLNGIAQKSTLLSVVAYENMFYFYVDKKLLMKEQDDLLLSGTVGMYAASADAGVDEVAFRNAKVWTL